MRTLSNLFRGLDGGGDSAIECRLAQAQEVGDGLALVLGTPASPAAPDQVAEFARFASSRGLDIRDLWVAGTGGRMEWAILPLYSPGRTVLLLTPGVLPANMDIGPLVNAVCREAAAKGIHLAQALTDPSDPGTSLPFLNHHFHRIADLLYLQVTAPRALAAPKAPTGFSWLSYSDKTHDLFAHAILQSYRDSLDCPGLNGLRTIQDVITGHRASGIFDSEAWFVLTDGTSPVAVLLLAQVPHSDIAELVYLGLSPAARGRGIGNLLVRQALHTVRHRMKLSHMTLAVDARNVPALKLYYRHGMQQIGTKTAMLRDLRTHPPRPVT